MVDVTVHCLVNWSSHVTTWQSPNLAILGHDRLDRPQNYLLSESQSLVRRVTGADKSICMVGDLLCLNERNQNESPCDNGLSSV